MLAGDGNLLVRPPGSEKDGAESELLSCQPVTHFGVQNILRIVQPVGLGKIRVLVYTTGLVSPGHRPENSCVGVQLIMNRPFPAYQSVVYVVIHRVQSNELAPDIVPRRSAVVTDGIGLHPDISLHHHPVSHGQLELAVSGGD